MNKNRVQKIMTEFQEVLNSDVPTNAEFLVLTANMLRVFAIAHIKKDSAYETLDMNNSLAVEEACYKDPSNLGLQIMLQCHVLLKLSEGFEDG